MVFNFNSKDTNKTKRNKIDKINKNANFNVKTKFKSYNKKLSHYSEFKDAVKNFNKTRLKLKRM